jgi:hypothetical protein
MFPRTGWPANCGGRSGTARQFTLEEARAAGRKSLRVRKAKAMGKAAGESGMG